MCLKSSQVVPHSLSLHVVYVLYCKWQMPIYNKYLYNLLPLKYYHLKLILWIYCNYKLFFLDFNQCHDLWVFQFGWCYFFVLISQVECDARSTSMVFVPFEVLLHIYPFVSLKLFLKFMMYCISLQVQVLGYPHLLQ